ncbi:MAG: gliding motility-associated C-terminal domain-containing protein [Brumimicrobium sp.]|nr:gliding motility-associated C-terminal domain-containing protein [Brumimicrobium sp.]
MPNGSFEEYSDCPEGREANNGQFERAKGWISPTFGTPDFLHRCSNAIPTAQADDINVPSNFAGFQEPFHGDGYALIFGVSWFSNGAILEGSEYIQCKLKSPLKPCHKYRFSMRISLADKSNLALNNIGVFASEGFFEPTGQFLDSNPQITFSEYVLDTSKWVNLSGEFISQNSSNHLTIGFYGNEEDSIYLYNPEYNDNDGHVAIYYIDSVSLVETDLSLHNICDEGVLMFPNIITPNNDASNEFLDTSEYFAITDEIVILNRWGNIITVLTENDPIWDGTTASGKPCSEGVYFYKFSYKWGDELKQKSGFIHLVR